MEVYQEKLPAVYRELHRLHRAALNHVFGAVGMHPGQAMALFLLTQRGMDGCMQRELAQALRVSAATVASSLARMENAGLVERYLDGEDSRRKLVYIHPARTGGGRPHSRSCQIKWIKAYSPALTGRSRPAAGLYGADVQQPARVAGKDFAGEPQKGEGNEPNQ